MQHYIKFSLHCLHKDISIIMYKTDDGQARLEDENVWLTQKAMSESKFSYNK